MVFFWFGFFWGGAGGFVAVWMLSWNKLCLTEKHFISDQMVKWVQERTSFYFVVELRQICYTLMYLGMYLCIFKISDFYQASSSKYNLGCRDVSSL